MTTPVPEPEFDQLHTTMTIELAKAITDMVDKAMDLKRGTMYRVQPPSTIIALAADAAASVFMAFERGYRME